MRRKPIDPFARKMIQGSFAFALVLVVMFAVLTAVYLHTRPRCSDRVVAEAASPDKKWTAALLERRCGEDAPFFAHVNIRPAGEQLQRGYFSGAADEGKVFEIEQDVAGAGVNLHWSTPGTLMIECRRCEPSLLGKHDEQWDGITLKYQLSSR
jgi:hypothetical protein